MHQIRSEAYRFLLENRVALPATKKELERIIVSKGWEIMSYREAETIFAANDRVAANRRERGEECESLRECAQRQDAFAMIGAPPIIFYRESMGRSRTLEAIAHEIGHLVLQHTHRFDILGKSGDRDTEQIQEREADVFAYELLAPQPVLRRCRVESPDDIVATDMLCEEQAEEHYKAMGKSKRYRSSALEGKIARQYREIIRQANYTDQHKILARCARLAAVLCLAGILVLGGIGAATLPWQEWGLFAEQGAQDGVQPEQVGVTKTGGCYHRAGCPYAGSVIAYFTAGEAEARGYRPCLHCMGAAGPDTAVDGAGKKEQ